MPDRRLPERSRTSVVLDGLPAECFKWGNRNPDEVFYSDLQPFSPERFGAYLSVLTAANVISGIRMVNISRCHFKGGLPVEIGQFTNLVRLELKENHIQGGPIDLSACVRLRRVALVHNILWDMPKHQPWIVLPPQLRRLRLVGYQLPDREVERLSCLHGVGLQIRQAPDEPEVDEE